MNTVTIKSEAYEQLLRDRDAFRSLCDNLYPVAENHEDLGSDFAKRLIRQADWISIGIEKYDRQAAIDQGWPKDDHNPSPQPEGTR